MGNCASLDCCSEQPEKVNVPEVKTSVQSPKIPLQLKSRQVDAKVPAVVQHKDIDVKIYDPYHSEELATKSFDDLELFTFDGVLTKTRVTSVYDGDTVTIVFYHSDDPIKDSFRMFGFDAPEMKPSKKMEHRELHIQAAKISRAKLEKMIKNKVVWVKFTYEEKYGRLMGELFFISDESPHKFTGTEVSINDWMIRNGFGKAYDGGHKADFTEEELLKIIASK